MTWGAQLDALPWARGMGYGVRREAQEGGVIYIYNLWLIHLVVWQKLIQHCKAFFLQIENKLKKKIPITHGKGVCPWQYVSSAFKNEDLDH